MGWRTRSAAAALLAGYGIFLLWHTSFSVGGSDSSGYLNTAHRLVSGTLVGRPRTVERFSLPDEVAHIFIPLGFVPGPRPGTMAPIYPSGFPAHMAGAALLLGWKNGPFLVSPLLGMLCLPLYFLLSRKLSLSVGWSLAGTVLFACWPVLLGQAIQPMSDAAAVFWSLAVILFAVRAREKPGWALAAGAALGIAVLVRPTNLLLAVPLAFALPLTLPALALAALGGVPFAAALLAYDFHCFGSPLQSGYGKVGLLTAIHLPYFPPRFRYYGGWILRTLTPVVPLAWLGAAIAARAPWRDRALVLSWFGTFFLFYCCYEPYESFWFVRFLLPAAPGLILGAMFGLRALAQRIASPAVRLAAAVVLASVILFAEVRSTRSLGLLHIAEGESIYPQMCAWAARTLPPDAVVFSMAASGALENYTALAYARWDWMSPEQFADLRPRIEQRGSGWYALLFPFEAEELSKHVPGKWTRIGELRTVGLWKLERN